MSAELLTTREAAAWLRIHPTTLLDWVKDGRIKHVRLATNVIRYRPRHIQEFIDQHLVTDELSDDPRLSGAGGL